MLQIICSATIAPTTGNAQFGALAADLIECRIANEEELQQRLKQIKLATRRYYHVMLINFPSDTERNKNIPWNYIINQLEYLFPFSNITTYKGEILLLIRKMKRRSRLSFNQETLLKLFEQHNVEYRKKVAPGKLQRVCLCRKCLGIFNVSSAGLPPDP